MIYFEDLIPGTIETFGHHEVQRQAVIDFAADFDPQPFHLSDEAAAQTHFGRIAASGWHSCAMAMRMMVDHMADRETASLGGIGIDELRWLRPVYPGDILRCETELLDKQPSRSRPEMGSFRARMTMFNQYDEPVMRFISIAMIAMRPRG